MNSSIKALLSLALCVACVPLHVSAAAVAGSASGADQIVASQGGVQVTLADVDEAMQKVPAERRAHFIDSPKRIESLISGLLLQKQLAVQARAAGLDSDPKIAAATGLEQVRLLAVAQSAHFKESIKVPDLSALAKERYQGNREKYVLPAVLEVQDILITTGARSDAEAKALAETIAADAKKDPGQFDALVQKYSGAADKAKSKGIVKDPAGPKYDAEFVAASKALAAPGDISPVFKTGDGFHVIRLVTKSEPRQQTFDEVREQIIFLLGDEYQRKAIQNYVDGLRNQPLDANAELIASLRTRYNDAEGSATSTTATAADGGAGKKP